MSVYAGKVNAPEFPAGLEWLNTGRPLTMRELRGKVVLLDFWTYCCINCMHVIPDLKRLEEKYRDELVVIGVHSAKFTTEGETASIRQAVLRYEIEHPVVNDRDFAVWNSYGVRAWPSFMIVDPDGKVVATHSGEGIFGLFDRFIGEMVAEFDAAGKIDRTPMELRGEVNAARDPLFLYPGKVAADTVGTTLYISDSGHNRIVAVALADQTVTEVIGDGEAGLRDGTFAEARFNKPQGLAVHGHTIYVADMENHAVRAIDIRARTVRTLAGTGRQAQEHSDGGEGRSVPLNSPWDLTVEGETIYIAMAGSHQIWTLDPATSQVRPYAGSGREDLIDGPPAEAALAQPSGITSDGRVLYIADSETSAVRSVGMGEDRGIVTTLVGEGLFEFGDLDGPLQGARLQHPLGVLACEGRIYVADTYNNKVKVIDPVERTCRTLAGAGSAGMKDGAAAEALLNEPGGIAMAGGRLYIADTNNHSIRIYDPRLREITTLQVDGKERLLRPVPEAGGAFPGLVLEMQQQVVRRGMGSFLISVVIPDGYHLNMEAPLGIRLRADHDDVVDVSLVDAGRTVRGPRGPIEIGAVFSEGETRVSIDLTVYYCETGREALCFASQIRVLLPVLVVPDGEFDSIHVSVPVA